MVINVNEYLQNAIGFDRRSEAIWNNLTGEARELRNAIEPLEHDIAMVVSNCAFGLDHALKEEKDLRTGKFRLAVTEEEQEIKNEEALRKSLLDFKKNVEVLLRVVNDMINKDALEMKLSKDIERIDFVEKGVFRQ